MPVSADLVELQKNGVADGVPVDCTMQCFDPTWIEVYYGTSRQKAVYNTDYTVDLADDYLSFTYTPTASLITKITALGEGNVTYVVRKPDVIQDFEVNDAFIRQRIVDLMDKAYMNLQYVRWLCADVIERIGYPTWGAIEGTLSDQADLQAALDAKVSTSVLTESVQDIVGAFLSGSGITATYSDVSNTLVLTITDGAVSEAKLATDAVATVKIKDANVTTAKLADGAVTTAKITDANVTTGKLADAAVTTAKITDANVTTAKLADGAVTTAKITDANVTTAKIADSNVTTGKLADGAVTNAKIADGTIATAKLATFTEDVQDVVGGLFIDSTHIDFTYTDGSNTLTAQLTAAVLARLLPSGGTADQVLAKVDSVDYNVVWVDAGAGGGGSGDMLRSTYDTDNDGTVDAAEAAPWSGITGKPSTFPPDAHTHPQSEITNLTTDLAAKAPLASPAFTGNPTAPTPSPGDNDTSIATTGFVKAAIDVILGGVSAAFDTLSEIATELALKAPLASPAFTGNPTAPTPSNGDNDTSIATTAFVTAAIAAASPFSPGDIKWAAYSATPSGWLECDGSAVSRSTYAALFTAISTTFGAGDGSTTFNLPDAKGRTAVGAGTGAQTETFAPAAVNATTDVITLASNPQDTTAKWQTGQKVRFTNSGGALPTGISAATDYWIRRTGATTITLYTTLAAALANNSTSGLVNITATGSGTHTIVLQMATRALGDKFGSEINGGFPSHSHTIQTSTGGSGSTITRGATTGAATNVTTEGDANGISNMPPSIVFKCFIKT